MIVAMAGGSQEEDRQRPTGAGFDQYLVKPVNPDALSRLLSELRES
jgi:CheY-like chemotaxis protein